jgi:hypothetical protein
MTPRSVRLVALTPSQAIEIIARSVCALTPRSVRLVPRKPLHSLRAHSALGCALRPPYTPYGPMGGALGSPPGASMTRKLNRSVRQR